MRYKMTRQCSAQSETVCAEFINLNDAILFVKNAEEAALEMKTKSLYWLFDDNQIILDHQKQKFNQQNATSKFADGDFKLPKIAQPFNIVIVDTNDAEYTLARFSFLKDAKIFVAVKLKSDTDENKDMTYYIFDGDKFFEKCDKNFNEGNASNKKMVFRPTPLLNKPRLGPANYWVEEDDDDNKNK